MGGIWWTFPVGFLEYNYDFWEVKRNLLRFIGGYEEIYQRYSVWVPDIRNI